MLAWSLVIFACGVLPACKSKSPPKPAPELAGLERPTPRARDFRRGVGLGLFASTDDARELSKIYGMLLDEIRSIGATDVELAVRWGQADVQSEEIGPGFGVETEDEVLKSVIEQAHARDLRVFLMPIVHVQKRTMGQWRGTIRPKNWDAWWSSYSHFILRYAELAQKSKVELFSVGSELVSTESQEERWRELISRVRSEYSGRLTYSANWDHFEPVSFWDAVDVIGVTAYQPLSDEANPTEEELVKGFRPFLGRLRFFARTRGASYMITEIGFPSHSLAAQKPWDYTEKGVAADLPLQLACYRAMYRALQADPQLSGLFVWNWFGFADETDRGYSPRGKPAQKVLEHWYTASRQNE